MQWATSPGAAESVQVASLGLSQASLHLPINRTTELVRILVTTAPPGTSAVRPSTRQTWLGISELVLARPQADQRLFVVHSCHTEQVLVSSPSASGNSARSALEDVYGSYGDRGEIQV